QMPLEATAARVLQRRLDARGPRSEVLNCGVSGYSPGQALLLWDRLSRSSPDRVFLLLSEIMMVRIAQRTEGTFGSRPLWVRPTFRLVEGRLVREPAADYDEVVRVQREEIERRGGRVAVARGLFLGRWIRNALSPWAFLE